MSNEIPRRNRLDQNTPAELAIRAAVDAVEALPADVRLTDAVVLLQEARESVADYVDGLDQRQTAIHTDHLAALERELAEARQKLDVLEAPAMNYNRTLARAEQAESALAAARAAVKAWEDKEASRGMCCWQMEQERNAARAEAARLRTAMQAALDSPGYMGSEDIDRLVAALEER